ncbi:Protocadherin alpha-3 [Lonchura striata]|uniref:Protocadherin alpha-3 n=1 Tax=Lonchura striata TaxID=40157 RepID=A0A218UNT9_9PASE|nr:Protocadherin alpha-3 [Lonchura striata domestica]
MVFSPNFPPPPPGAAPKDTQPEPSALLHTLLLQFAILAGEVVGWSLTSFCLFLLAVVLYVASRWAPRAAVLSGPGPTTLVCASEVGSWSYSQRHSRSLCVADGAAKSDLMVFSPNFPPPPPGAAPKDTQPEPSALLHTGESLVVFDTLLFMTF